MIYWTYNILLILWLPVALLLVLRRAKRGTRLARGFEERLGFLGAKRPFENDHPVWFHAS